MTTIDATEARFNAHEMVCAERYEQINARLKRIEGIMLKTAGLMIVSMAGTIFSAVWMLKEADIDNKGKIVEMQMNKEQQ
jgi:hypothetical protein